MAGVTYSDGSSPVITRSSADPCIGSVYLHSDASETAIEIQIRRAVRHAVDTPQLRGHLLEDAIEILDPVGVVHSPAGSLSKQLQLLPCNHRHFSLKLKRRHNRLGRPGIGALRQPCDRRRRGIEVYRIDERICLHDPVEQLLETQE